MVTARREEDLFWAMEEGLRCPGIAAVVGETRAADPTAGRRLSLAAEKSGVPALLAAPAARTAAKRLRHALAGRLGAVAVDAGPQRSRRLALEGRAAAQSFRHAVGC